MARLITVYAVLGAPVFFLLSSFAWLNSLLDGRISELWFEVTMRGIDAVTMVFLFIGGFKLRGLRPSGPALLRGTFWTRIAAVAVGIPLGIVVAAAANVGGADRLTSYDLFEFTTAFVAIGLEVASLVWLRRNKATLDAIIQQASTGRGPYGTMVVGHKSSGSAAPAWSHSAVWGAALTGLSLPIPLLLLAALISRSVGIGPGELWLTLGCAALPGLAGTILGWVALSNIREGRGRVRGLPLAMFAGLAWPLLVVVGLAVGIPSLTLVTPSGDDNRTLLGRLFVLILPAGAITFVLWAVQAASRWAGGQPVTQRRGVLKWVFAALMVAGLGIVILPNLEPRQGPPSASRPSPVIQSSPAVPAGTDPLRVRFKVPKGQVGIFQLCRHTGFNEHELLPLMAGYVVAPDDESAPGEVRLEPTGSWTTMEPAQMRWMMSIMIEDGASVGMATESFGTLRLSPNVRMPLRAPAPPLPQNSVELSLTDANPINPADIEHPVQPALGLAITLIERPRHLPAPRQALVGSGTNWEPGLLMTVAAENSRPAAAKDVPGRIRFTIVAVDLRDDSQGRWLAMDYVANVEGDCERVFRVEADRFKTTTRKTELALENPGFGPIRHQRLEWKLPDALSRDDALEFRNELAKALVTQSIDVRAGEEKPLFRLPVADLGTLAAWVGAKARGPSP